MRRLLLAAALAATSVGVWSRPAAAQWGPPSDARTHSAENLPPPDTARDPVTAANDAARLRDLREQLFAHEALRLSGSRITRGEVPMHVTTFYALVGRPDLNESIHRRRVAKGILIGTGAALSGFGFAWAIADGLATSVDNGLNRATHLCGTSEVDPQCEDRSHTSALPWGIAIMGGFTLVAGLALPSDPLTAYEKTALADEYNQKLRARMKLSDTLDTAARSATMSAAVVPGQAGMLLAGCAF